MSGHCLSFYEVLQISHRTQALELLGPELSALCSCLSDFNIFMFIEVLLHAVAFFSVGKLFDYVKNRNDDFGRLLFWWESRISYKLAKQLKARLFL